MELSLGTLTTIGVVAELQSFTAAAAALGYTQSAVSRQVAAAEREFGAALFDRVRGGVRLTPAGSAVLRQVVVILDAVKQAQQAATQAAPQTRQVRLGAFAAAGSALVPRSLATLRRTTPDIEAGTREAPSPSLVRAVRSGSLDFAVITARPPYRSPDQERPRLMQHELLESRLALAVPAASRYAAADVVDIDAAARAAWIATASSSDEPQLGVWPGLPGRPRVRHWARDWTTKLNLVADGAGVTTVPLELFPLLPEGVALVRIAGVPEERRLVSLVHRRDADAGLVTDVVEAFSTVAGELMRGRRRTLS